MDLHLGAKLVIVTGATSGSGLATAHVLANEGAPVVAVARRVPDDAVLPTSAEFVVGDLVHSRLQPFTKRPGLRGTTTTASSRSLSLKRPIMPAPISGGPSTPQLCAAVQQHGLGFLAAGYLNPGNLGHAIEEVNGLTTAPYGVNILVPGRPGDDNLHQGCIDYRDSLIADGACAPEVFPKEPEWSTDHYDEKIELVASSSAAYVSFTFGHSDYSVIRSRVGI